MAHNHMAYDTDDHSTSEFIIPNDYRYILPPRANKDIDESYWRTILDQTQMMNMQENIINNFIINPR